MRILTEIPNIDLYKLNNYLIEHPVFIGLKFIDGKVYGIVSEVHRCKREN